MLHRARSRSRSPRTRWIAASALPAARRYLPGLGAVAAGVAVSYGLNRQVPAVSALTFAVVLGVVARNVGLLGSWSGPGTTIATRKLLRTGVVLLGLQLAVPQVLGLGAGQLLVVLVTVTATFAGTLWLGPRIGVRRETTLLVATGVSICGASAAAAMHGVSDSDDDDLATAVALVTLFGSLAIVVLPLLQHPLGLDDTAFGVWAGASVHEVAQVVATASTVGATALASAVVVKLTRVVLLAPLVAGASMVRRSRTAEIVPGARPPLMPAFVLGFLAMIGVRSSGLVPDDVLAAAKTVTTLLFAGALFGLGTSVHLRSLVRTGGRAAVLGAAATLVAVSVSYLGIVVLL